MHVPAIAASLAGTLCAVRFERGGGSAVWERGPGAPSWMRGFDARSRVRGRGAPSWVDGAKSASEVWAQVRRPARGTAIANRPRCAGAEATVRETTMRA